MNATSLRTTLRTAAVIGTGSIGSSWSALALAHGVGVHASDPAPGAEQRLRESLADHLVELAADPAALERLRFHADPAAAAEASDLVIEAGSR